MNGVWLTLFFSVAVHKRVVVNRTLSQIYLLMCLLQEWRALLSTEKNTRTLDGQRVLLEYHLVNFLFISQIRFLCCRIRIGSHFHQFENKSYSYWSIKTKVEFCIYLTSSSHHPSPFPPDTDRGRSPYSAQTSILHRLPHRLLSHQPFSLSLLMILIFVYTPMGVSIDRW